MIDRAALRIYATALPAGSAVPVPKEWLLDLLDGDTPTQSLTSPDLTVAEVAERFGRAQSTVRSWVVAGRLEGYKLRGRELRFTRAALNAFEAEERRGNHQSIPAIRSARKPVDLDAYRNVS